MTSCFALLCTRATASMFLERQIQNVEGIVSGCEKQLASDGVIPDKADALQTRNQHLQVSYCFIQLITFRLKG